MIFKKNNWNIPHAIKMNAQTRQIYFETTRYSFVSSKIQKKNK